MKTIGLLGALGLLVCAASAAAQGLPAGVPDGLEAARAAAGRAAMQGAAKSSAAPTVALPGAVDPREYRLGPGDALSVTVWGRVTRSEELLVGPEGYVVLPDAGTLKVDGLTLEEGRDRILAALRRELVHVQMDVRLSRPRRFVAYLTGQVREPGPVEALGTTRVSDLLTTERLLENSSHRRIEVQRRDGTWAYADLDLFLLTGDLTLNPYVRDGDVLQVPVATEFIYANGALARPGRFELGPRDSLFTLLLLAGDPAPSASADRALLIRWTEPFRPDSLWLALGDIYSRRVNPPLSDGDRLYAYFVPRYHEQHEVVVEGEVARPGTYPIVPGVTRISDVVRAADGFLPEADLSAIRILRANPSANEKDPEFDRLLRLSRAELTSSEYEKLRTKLAAMREEYRVDWNRVRSEKSTVDLLMLNGDVVRVQKLVTSIRVDGEVRHPGTLAFQPGLKVDDYIRQAGGYSNRAWHGKVRVTRSITGQTLYARDVTSLGPGDFVWVPEKPDLNLSQAGLSVLAAAASIATIALAIVTLDNNK